MIIKANFPLRDQSGAALVIALIMIVVLTVISLASSLTSIFEIKLSGNKRGSTDAFYTADGGIQATVANIANFDSSTYTPIAAPGSLPPYILEQSVDSNLTPPAFPAGVNFTDPPNVIIYHATRTGAPRGLGFGGAVEYQYYIIDSTGRDQTETDLLKSTCEIVETVVRLMPSSQGGP